jgi:hypothetical protein
VLNELDGFNQHPRISIPFDGDIDVSTATSDTIFLVEAPASAGEPAVGSSCAFAAADVTPDFIAPELHVIALAQTAATDDGMVATVLSVVLGRRGSKAPADVIQPLKTTDLTTQYQNLVGTAFKGTGVVATFPLSALMPDMRFVSYSIERLEASPGWRCAASALCP